MTHGYGELVMKKLLIVEDNQVIASIYRAKFQAEGFEVEVAADGAAGLEMINRIRPDAVVLDQMLPNLTGLEVLRRVRAEPALQSLPIFMFFNSMIGSMVQEAWASGATEVLTKATHTPKQVVEAVKKALTAFASPSTLTIATPPAPETASLAHAHEPDARGQSGFQKNSADALPGALTALHELHSVFTKNTSDPARLLALHARVHAVATQASGASGLHRFSRLAAALETLLKELHEKPKCVNSSVLRTLFQSISYLTPLFERSSYDD